jgi:hypothetical protein
MTRPPLLSLFLLFALAACEPNAIVESPADATATVSWPGESWQTTTPEREGLDAQAIAQLDEELRAGKHDRKAWIRRRLRSWMKNSAPESTVTLIPC